MEWQAYFAEELKLREREHFYLAQVAYEIRLGNAKNPRNVKFDDFLLKFEAPEGHRTEEDKQARAAASKQSWLGMMAAFKGKKMEPPKRD